MDAIPAAPEHPARVDDPLFPGAVPAAGSGAEAPERDRVEMSLMYEDTTASETSRILRGSAGVMRLAPR